MNLTEMKAALIAAKETENQVLINMLENAIKKAESKKPIATGAKAAKIVHAQEKKTGKIEIDAFETEMKSIFNRFNTYKKETERMPTVSGTFVRFESMQYKLLNVVGLLSFNDACKFLVNPMLFNGQQVYKLVSDYLFSSEGQKIEIDNKAQQLNEMFKAFNLPETNKFYIFSNLCKLYGEKAKGAAFTKFAMLYTPEIFKNESLYNDIFEAFKPKEGEAVDSTVNKYLQKQCETTFNNFNFLLKNEHFKVGQTLEQTLESQRAAKFQYNDLLLAVTTTKNEALQLGEKLQSAQNLAEFTKIPKDINAAKKAEKLARAANEEHNKASEALRLFVESTTILGIAPETTQANTQTVNA